mgnify:CR=1 FL=1
MDPACQKVPDPEPHDWIKLFISDGQVPQLLERFKVTTRIKKNPFKADK